ncbi:MAG: hypothetical protein IT429_21815 [Gemmataceae bacterium]|nr:hypothetical protein [Gemmataceae bacterium]
MSQRTAWLLGASLLAWGLTAYPAYALGGEHQLALSAVALAVCLVPALVTMLWAEWTFRRAPEQYLLMVLGGTGLRMFVVLGAAIVLLSAVEYLRGGGLLIWILAFYLITLTFEMVFLLAGRASPAAPDRSDQD